MQVLVWKDTGHVLSISSLPVLLLVWHPTECWALLSRACSHRYVCVCHQETALPEDWVGFMNQWPRSSLSDFKGGDASFPPCHRDVPGDWGIAGRSTAARSRPARCLLPTGNRLFGSKQCPGTEHLSPCTSQLRAHSPISKRWRRNWQKAVSSCCAWLGFLPHF